MLYLSDSYMACMVSGLSSSSVTSLLDLLTVRPNSLLVDRVRLQDERDTARLQSRKPRGFLCPFQDDSTHISSFPA
jgi:hypothetical protein